ncbi:hypothetical protein APS56_13605 [Pseudalgibacter alginicilyticus]|uniref:DUF4157 domain-containing protein n=1 Tax=Pseudalgibacter alginicilyticus TaxID=1736674 RepID=A0A0P0CZL6_9FLAO|nr:hypothetical protein [Pseudalgibacter alginicilyticus]ALJ06099.1 hypothetical protein APS56_13605 [Pseudalgibacter alginicilyticus]
MIFISKYLVPNGYLGITIFPFVFLKYKGLREDTVLINHENIHLKQQLEMLIIPFYLFYGIEFLIRLFQYENSYLAYRNISFEREAFFNESNLNYIKRRKFWSFLKYLRQYDF